MKKIATPNTSLRTFADLIKTFGAQVNVEPSPGQRHHKEQNAKGRKHIQDQANVLSTQAILHAVINRGKFKMPITLIDGYHRVDEWARHGCPFDKLILVEHEIHADTKDEMVEQVDRLQRSLDSKEAVKTNADRWCAAIRDAGLTQPQSQAYKFGTKANSFFRRTLKKASDSMLKLTERASDAIAAHIFMDLLFQACEQELSAADMSKYFHAGVSTAIFNHVQTLTTPVAQLHASNNIVSVIVALGAKSRPSTKAVMVLTPAAQALFDLLVELANEPANGKLRAIGCREEFYDAVDKLLQPALADIANPGRAAPSKRKTAKR